MKNSLRRLTALAGLLLGVLALSDQFSVTGPVAVFATAAAASTPPAEPLSNSPQPIATGQQAVGDRLVVEAASRLERRRSVTARLRHQVALDGEQLYGVGSYWQQGSGEDLRVRMELQIAGQETRLLQISNSRFLWLDRALPAGRKVTRIDLRQLRADPALAAASANTIRPGEASWSPAQSSVTACCGGLPRLLAALGENFSFLPPQAMRLVAAPGSDSTGVPLFAVVGHWKPEKLSALAGIQAPSAASQAPSKLEFPDRLPQEVLLLVDQTDLFPYRIEYRPLETANSTDPSGRPIPYQLSARPMVVLEFSNVAFDVPIAAGQFDYAPPDVNWVDYTATVLERLRQQHPAKIAASSNAEPNPLPAH